MIEATKAFVRVDKSLFECYRMVVISKPAESSSIGVSLAYSFSTSNRFFQILFGNQVITNTEVLNFQKTIL